MRFNFLKKWALRFVAGLVVLFLVLIVVIKVQVDRVYGGHTKLVDHTEFQIDSVLTAITNVNVLSPNGERMLANRTVVLSEGKILSITEAGPAPSAALIIDGGGKFLIPGLVDSHVHLQHSTNDLLLFVANGVTHVRDMAGSKADARLRDEIEEGRIGPRIFATSPTLNTGSLLLGWLADSVFHSHTTQNAEQAVKVARAFAEQGFDGLKLYEFLDMESFRAVTSTASDIGIPTIGHLPPDFELNELRTTELSELAHIEELVQALLIEFGSFDSQGPELFRQFVEGRSDEIAAGLAANDIPVHSVLWYMESLERQVFDLENLLSEVSLEYANPGCVEGASVGGFGWLPERNKFQPQADRDPEELRLDEIFWVARKEAHYILIEAMLEHGVQILVATDTNSTTVVPGFSIHDELKSLNKAGMSPSEALYAATVAPAELMSSNAGIIGVGRRADLVLLNANPLADIANTSAIHAVILNGRYFDRQVLDNILNAVAQANAESRNFDLERFQ